MFRRSLLALTVACSAVHWAAAPTPNPSNSLPNPATQEPFTQGKPNLARVLVFVYRPYAWKSGSLAKDAQCQKDTREAARRALQGHKFPKPCFIKDTQCQKDALKVWREFQSQFQRQKSCEEPEQNLTLDDFQLYQDGQLQQIKSIERGRGALRVYENGDWHREVSDRPPGRWSSADQEHPLSYFSSLAVANLYLLDYLPPRATSGRRCHQMRVKVRSPDIRAFAQGDYCEGQTLLDPLYGTKTGNTLQGELARGGLGKIPLSVQTGTFRADDGRRLADVVIEFPWKQLQQRRDGPAAKLYASIGVLGGIYTRDGKLVTRLSDLLWPSYWPAIVKYGRPGPFGGGYSSGCGYSSGNTFNDEVYDMENHRCEGRDEWDRDWLPTRYETQLELAPGEYILRAALSDGFNAGRTEVPFSVEKDDGEPLSVGSVLLCKHFRNAPEAAVKAEAAKFAPQYVPIVSKGVQVTPAGDTSFAPGERLLAYFEISGKELSLKSHPQIQACLRIIEAKTGAVVKEFPLIDAAEYEQDGSSIIRIAREVPAANIPPGEYRLEVQASDSTGRKTPWRAANFTNR